MHSQPSRVDRRVILRSILGGAAAGSAALFAPLPAEALLRYRQEAESAGSGELLALSPAQARVVAEATERILPRTDTPGAKDAEVHLFVDRLLAHWFLEPERRAFLAGVDELERTSRERFGASFVEADDEQRDALLTELEDAAFTARRGQPWTQQPEIVVPPELAGLAFFDVLRWLTLVGYYTSEVGMKAELGYRVVPGRYEGCVQPAAPPDTPADSPADTPASENEEAEA